MTEYRKHPDPFYKHYQFGDDGSVESDHSGVWKPITGAPNPHRGGYIYSSFYGDGTKRTKAFHRLIAEAWHGLAPPGKPEAAHWDGDPANNRPDNLRWATRKENETDKTRHGTLPRGEKHSFAVLTEADVYAIRTLADRGDISQSQIAALYGIHQTHVSEIKTRRQWKHLPERSPDLSFLK